MVFNTGAALLDAIVLSVVSKDVEGTYGYRITQDVREVIEISDSTLYPVLRRLQKEECLEVYDMAIDGRNRRYYKITEKGRVQLNLYRYLSRVQFEDNGIVVLKKIDIPPTFHIKTFFPQHGKRVLEYMRITAHIIEFL